MKVHVITISDRAAAGVYEDRSGPEIESVLREAIPASRITRTIVPDEADAIRNAILAAAGRAHAEAGPHSGTAFWGTASGPGSKSAVAEDAADFILTTGGTGISPRDITPEVTAALIERRLPGIAEALRAVSLAETPSAMLSRGEAGLIGETIIVNFPGSVRACRLCTTTLIPVMQHALAMREGKGH